jgi:hypothetical protein
MHVLSHLFGGLVVLFSATACLAQTAAPPPIHLSQVLVTPRGTVEVIGLNRWTLRMLHDSVAAHTGGESLFSSACQAVIRDKLGFAAAHVSRQRREREPGKWSEELIITVVEPQDSSRVRFRAPATGTFPFRTEWSEAIAPFIRKNGVFIHRNFMYALQPYGRILLGHRAQVERELAEGRGVAEAARLWTFLAQQQGEEDRQLASTTLEHDGNEQNRIVAAAVLANHSGRDQTWWLLMDAVRDERENVRQTARAVLSLLGQTRPRKVEWAPAIPAIRHVLSGTHVPAFLDILEVLLRTDISPADARAVLWNNGDLVLAHLAARNDVARNTARRFLLRASGQDFGGDISRWEEWIRALE